MQTLLVSVSCVSVLRPRHCISPVHATTGGDPTSNDALLHADSSSHEPFVPIYPKGKDRVAGKALVGHAMAQDVTFISGARERDS
jgi:hypothetical protein